MINSLRCLLARHNWGYFQDTPEPYIKCHRCGKVEKGNRFELRRKVKNLTKPGKRVIRNKEVLLADQVFEAWTSGDLDKMLAAVKIRTNPIDRHHLLMRIVDESYKLRNKSSEYAAICAKHSEIHIGEFPNLLPALLENWKGVLLRVKTFQHYATLLTEQGKYSKAIEVCEFAKDLGFSDGTKSGFEGRIERIEKKRSV